MEAKHLYEFLSLIPKDEIAKCSLYGDYEGGVAVYHNSDIVETILLDDSDEHKDLLNSLVRAFGEKVGESIYNKWSEYLKGKETNND